MNELRLVFHLDPQTGTSVKALPVWSGSDATQPVPFDFSLGDDDFEDLRWYLEDFMDLPDGGAVVRAEGIEGKLRNWGRQLHDTVFTSSENQVLLEQLLQLPEPRVLTIGTADPGLLRLPWELIADGAGPLAHRLSVRRQLETPEDLVERPVVLPLRILYIVSRPGDTGFIDPRVTARSVLDALDPLGASVQMDFCRPPTVSRMEELLREAERAGDPYDLVHFDGHGTFDSNTQLGALLFENTDGNAEALTDLVGADRLGDILAAHQVPLVILEACRSASVGRTAVFRSVAPRLIQAGVSSVLSMGHAVHVDAARLLLDRFYRELVRGTTIGHAVAQARLALHGTPGRWIEYGPQGRTISLQDWFLPHLYQRGLDEPLLPPSIVATSSAQPRKFDLFLSHNHADSDRVERLARLLVEKQGLRVWLDKWECGPGQLKPQCESGIKNSRYTVVVGSEAALRSEWVEWEIQKALELNPDGAKVLPIKFEPLTLPEQLDALLWVDFTDSTRDELQAALLAQLIRSSDAEDAQQRRGFRSPTTNKAEVGAFPPAPLYEFQGRARELHELERHFRKHRGVVLHAMGGMGKTALATEAAHWWTRSGLFRDGACFVSFEQFASVERVEQVLGTYLEGPGFESLPSTEQRRRAIELFNEKNVLLVWD
ncbi:MAG TPA: TIR domain-containing protein, partial [Pyrinomonadaceae bacterium]|nr:TIR domain-containing protein [Pyrinomonadaceae bacterium]